MASSGLPRSAYFSVNFVSDDCLRTGGEQSGVIDFYQIHTYAFGGAWNPSAPFNGVCTYTIIP